MPKPRPRNAFYFFMLDFRDDQKAEGVTLRSMTEVAEVAAPAWKELPAPARKKYEDMAKLKKNDGVKLTSIGVSVAEMRQRKADEEYFDKLEKNESSQIIKTAIALNEITHTDFIIMDVNVGCRTIDDFIICEMTLLRFNIIDGLLDCYHEIINPGKIPMGYASDIKASCQEMGLVQPDEFKPITNYKSILANIMALMKSCVDSNNRLPPVFTMPEKVEAVENFIVYLCMLAREDVSPFRVYKLHRLFFYLVNGISSTFSLSTDDQYTDELCALTVLLKDKFKYYPGIACQHHEDLDKAGHCTSSRAKGWVFMMLEKVCPMLNVNMRPFRHMPPDADPGGIVTEFGAPVRNKVQPFPKKVDEDLLPQIPANLKDEEDRDIVRQPKTNYALEASVYSSQQCGRPDSSATHQAEGALVGTRPASQQSTRPPSSMNIKNVLGSFNLSGSKRLSGIGRGKALISMMQTGNHNK